MKKLILVSLTAILLGSAADSFAEEVQQFKARGLVRSDARIELRSDLMAMVTSSRFSEGTTFQEGDKLVSFDCRKYQAELDSARASARGANVELKNKISLRRNGAAGKSEVSIARAAAEKANHDVKALKARMNYCSIRAPFSGRVVERNVRELEMPTNDKPLMVIIDDNSLELELVVPSLWLTWLKQGQKFSFFVDETQQDHAASVERIGAEVDPVSQTIKLYAKLEKNGARILAGMSGTATFMDAGI